MRTNIEISDQLMEEALKLPGSKTKRAVGLIDDVVLLM